MARSSRAAGFLSDVAAVVEDCRLLSFVNDTFASKLDEVPFALLNWCQ